MVQQGLAAVRRSAVAVKVIYFAADSDTVRQ